jgi:hypothetical protein
MPSDPRTRPVKSPNAYLRYWDTATGQFVRRYLWVMEVEQTHELSGSTYQSQYYQHFYGKSYAPGPVTVNGRVPTQAHYDALAEFIRKHQLLLINQPGASNLLNPNPSDPYSLPLLTLAVPSEGLNLEGYVTGFQGGAKRFNPAPPFNFDFVVINDAHSVGVNVSSVAHNAFFFKGWNQLTGEILTTDDRASDPDPITGDDEPATPTPPAKVPDPFAIPSPNDPFFPH